MRIKNTLKNSGYAIFSYATLALLSLVIRRFFLDRLPTDFLGYEGLFSDIFAILSIAELGIGNVINYRLYPALANNDETLINKLMSIYKLLYRIVGFGVLTIGIILVPFLKIIIKDNQYDWNYVYIIFGLQLLSSLCSYFLAYRRVLLVVDQREAVCTKIELGCSIGSNIIKMVVLLTMSNYLAYLGVSVLNNIVTNIIIYKKVGKDYSYINRVTKIKKTDISELGLSKDIKNNLFQKVSLAVYGGTDSILISAMLGIGQVGLMTNYSLIIGHVTNVFTKLLNPFQAAISNYVYDRDSEDHEPMFWMFDRIGFFMASFISISFFVLLNPFIVLWIGEKYLLSGLFVLALAINQYITYAHKFLCFYRNAFGKFEIDKYYLFAGAVINIVLSIIGAKMWGIAGIMFGTAIGHMGFWIGRIRVVFKEYLPGLLGKYVFSQLFNGILWILELAFTYWICSFLPATLLGFMAKMLIVVVVPNGVNLLVFRKTDAMAMIFEYLKRVKETIHPNNRLGAD